MVRPVRGIDLKTVKLDTFRGRIDLRSLPVEVRSRFLVPEISSLDLNLVPTVVPNADFFSETVDAYTNPSLAVSQAVNPISVAEQLASSVTIDHLMSAINDVGAMGAAMVAAGLEAIGIGSGPSMPKPNEMMLMGDVGESGTGRANRRTNIPELREEHQRRVELEDMPTEDGIPAQQRGKADEIAERDTVPSSTFKDQTGGFGGIDSVDFRLSESNIVRVGDKVISLGFVPNQAKANMSDGNLPDVVIIPAHVRSGRVLSNIFFGAAVASAQRGKPLTVVVPGVKILTGIETYLLEGYRPVVVKQLDRTSLPAVEKSALGREFAYFDQFETHVDRMVSFHVVKEGEVGTLGIRNMGGGFFEIGDRMYGIGDIKNVSPHFSGDINPVLNWRPTFGVLVLGNTSGPYPNAPSTNMIVRYTDGSVRKSLWIDCGPQMKGLARAAGEDIHEVHVLVTHGHEDHDSGLWELLADGLVKRIHLYSHTPYIASFTEKSLALGLHYEMIDKVELHRIDPKTEVISSTGEYHYVNGLQVATHWGIHGMPTVMVKVKHQGRVFFYTSDGAYSRERIETLMREGVVNQARIDGIKKFMGRKADLFIEEMGATMEDGRHVGGHNHSNSLDTLQPGEVAIHKVVHWNGGNRDQIPDEKRARTFEPLTIIP